MARQSKKTIKEENNKHSMQGAELATNPVSANQKPSSARGKKSKTVADKILSPSNERLVKNPSPSVTESIVKNREILAQIKNINSAGNTNKMYRGFLGRTITPKNVEIDYVNLIGSLSIALQGKKTMNDLFIALHSVFSEKLNCTFTAFGYFHEKSKCINLKLLNTFGGTYSSKVFLSEDLNPIVECFTTSSAVIHKDNKYLNIPYLQSASTILLPMTAMNETVGVMILGTDDVNCNISLLSFVANYAAMFIQNLELRDKTNKFANTDTLTSLYNHRGFQEVLANELQKASDTETQLSIVMFDINNISKINRELGHAKGDEVIKLLAEKIKQNARSNDKAGRYGGDEIAVILPNTNTADAKYLAEYITYTLSCCFVDDVGPVKVSVGISTYPNDTKDQEKLLILAEQAMYISQAKGYKEGMSAIISSSDFNFWDDAALNSFAEVIAKRHAQLGINFEDELVHKFNNEEIISQNHLIEMVTSLAGAIDAKDPYTKGHSTSVSRYSEALARAINLPEDEVQKIRLGGLLHDVGKIGIPENVLRKPGKLENDEWEIMKQHPVIGAEKVLAPNEALAHLIPIVKYHHEHIDGSGYPEHLKGDEIPFAARIVAVADTYHALISDRPYRKGMTVEKACEILQDGAGKLWDADLVRHFIAIAPSLATII